MGERVVTLTVEEGGDIVEIRRTLPTIDDQIDVTNAAGDTVVYHEGSDQPRLERVITQTAEAMLVMVR